MLPASGSGKCTPKAPVRKAPCRKEAKSVAGGEISCSLSNRTNPPNASVQHHTSATGRSARQGSAVAGPSNIVLGRSQPSHSPSRPTDLCQRPSSSRVCSSSSSNTISVRTRAGLSPSGPNGPVDRPTGSGRIPSNSNNAPPSSKSTQKARAGPADSFAIGIEFEMLIKARTKDLDSSYGALFRQILAINYNLQVNMRYPRMDESIFDEHWASEHNDFKKWTLSSEGVVQQREMMQMKVDKWAVELRSPKLRTDEAPDWRSTVKETWAFIQRNYIVGKNEECSTHVHVSMIRGGQAGRPEQSGMSLENMKKIAQCVIHFEPALEVLVPNERRGNGYAMSNWIDNNNFAQEHSTREAVIGQIDGCTTEDELIKLMCPGPRERYFAFNFRAIKEFGTIEYRKGSASLNGDEAVAWADLALLFVQAAVQVKPESLSTVPANIKALKEFLGTKNLRYLQPLFGGKQPNESQQPKICSGERTGPRRDMLVRKLKADEEKQQRLAQQQ